MTLGLAIRDDGSVPRAISELWIRDDTNTPREIVELWMRDLDNVPRLVFNPTGSATLTVEVVPAGASGFSSGTGTATTGTVTASASGGTPPYTHAWTLQDYSSLYATPTANSPSAATTDFTQTSLQPNSIETSNWIDTVTDDNGATAESDPVPANFTDVS